MVSIHSIIILFSGFLALFLGLIVLAKNRKAKVNQIFFLFILCIVIWFSATFMMFTSKTDAQMIFWDRIVYLGVIFIPVVGYHFGLVFTKMKEHRKLLQIGYFFSFVFLLLSQTDYFIADLYKYNWGVHTQARFFHHIFLLFFIFYISLFYLNVWRYQKKATGIEKFQANYVLFAFLVLAISSLAFLLAYGIDIGFPFPYLAAILYVLLLSFAILKYHLFEIRVILTELLVGVMGIILLILPFLMPTVTLKILTVSIFLLFLIFAYYLIKATHEESKRREEAEKYGS